MIFARIMFLFGMFTATAHGFGCLFLGWEFTAAETAMNYAGSIQIMVMAIGLGLLFPIRRNEQEVRE
ncbi:hypothetical protein [Falsigemmobacter faecalis]|uniref:Uncharacterized protein n=1 Tax=Falsigemmobacter faecalis TaxID=2488730 RepID=A0A3P3DES7_9RHOB|nr:hypothetical protein [Falsigemmobacter faecalis]RRH72012.1 hypothetical protein EG244_15980 [Falsigemmobacter faecalis]